MGNVNEDLTFVHFTESEDPSRPNIIHHQSWTTSFVASLSLLFFVLEGQ